MVCLLRRRVLTYQKEPREQAWEPALEDADYHEMQPSLRVSTPSVMRRGHVVFSPLLDQGCDRQAAGICLSGTHKKTKIISTNHF